MHITDSYVIICLYSSCIDSYVLSGGLHLADRHSALSEINFPNMVLGTHFYIFQCVIVEHGHCLYVKKWFIISQSQKHSVASKTYDI